MDLVLVLGLDPLVLVLNLDLDVGPVQDLVLVMVLVGPVSGALSRT